MTDLIKNGGNKMLCLMTYRNEYEEKWDKFVLEESLNGTFLQTRKFLNYHPIGRFTDNSLLFIKGNAIVAVIPANIIVRENCKIFISHQGSTFGGIILGKQFKKLAICEEIFSLLDEYVIKEKITKIKLKYTGALYVKSSLELLDYFAFLNGYTCSFEMGYCIEFNEDNKDFLLNLSSSKRRDYRYSLKNKLQFIELANDQNIARFYDILCDNYEKFERKPVHTLEEILELSKKRFPDFIRFYGVIHENDIIAGAMIFLFDHVFHTQYLACMQNKTFLFANEFMYMNLIETARNLGFQRISFGTSTLQEGRLLNKPLAQFKEGFGTIEYVNKTYTKEIIG